MAAPYQTGLVVGRFLSVVADSVDDTDQEPEIVPMSGTVTFTPQVSAVKVVEGADVPATVNVAPVSATLDSEGYLSRNGQRGIRLLATDGPTNPTGFTYQVSFALTLGGGAAVVKYNPFPVQVPSGRTVDLTVAAPVPSSSGVSMVQGVGVQDVTVENGEFVFRLTNGAESRTPAPTGGGAVTVESDGLGTYTINGSQVKGLTAEGQLPAAAKKYVDDGLAIKSDAGHAHTTADVAGLDTALAGKAPLSHTHSWDDIQGKPTDNPASKLWARKQALGAMLAVPKGAGTERPTVVEIRDTDVMPSGVNVPYLDATNALGSTNMTMWRRDSGMEPMEFFYDGTELQIKYTVMDGNGKSGLITVDGVPAHDGVLTNDSLVVNGDGYLHLKWATARRRRVWIMMRGAAVLELKTTSIGDPVQPAPASLNTGVVIDSYGTGTLYSGNYDSLVYMVPRNLNTSVLTSYGPGSGYTSPGAFQQRFDADARRDYFKAAAPLDLLMFWGSVNDSSDQSDTVLTQAYRDTWTAYASDHQGTPIVVFGVQPTAAITTISSGIYKLNKLMYQEAAKHPNVVGFVDMLGVANTTTQPVAWSSASTYGSGDLVSFEGSYYKCVIPDGASVTGASQGPSAGVHWRRVTWSLSGTGNAGAVAMNGTRDVFLAADNVHPTVRGHEVLGNLASQAILRVLNAPTDFTYFNV